MKTTFSFIHGWNEPFLFFEKNVDKLVWLETLGILFANYLPVP